MLLFSWLQSQILKWYMRYKHVVFPKGLQVDILIFYKLQKQHTMRILVGLKCNNNDKWFWKYWVMLIQYSEATLKIIKVKKSNIF